MFQRCNRRLVIAALLSLFIALSSAAWGSTLTWQKVELAQAPGPRAAFATAYDPVSHKVVIFGGVDATGALDETWTFDGRTWRQVQTTVAPSARSGAAMAYDYRTQKLVLFGGTPGFGFLRDTWLWDGATSTWTQANPHTVPTGATNPMLFADPANGHAD